MKSIKYLIVTLFALVALAGSAQVTIVEFDQDTLSNTDTSYFLYPEVFREGSFGRPAITYDQNWQLQLTNAPDTAVAVGYLQTTNFTGSTPTWAPTGDTLLLTGNQSGFISKQINARRSRIMLIQTGTATSYSNAAVRTVPHGN